MWQSAKARSQEDQNRRHREYVKRIEELRQRIDRDRANRRRFRLLFLLLLLQFEQLKIGRMAWWPPIIDVSPEETKCDAHCPKARSKKSSVMDFDPEPCNFEYGNAHSRETWQQLAERKGVKLSTKNALMKQWKNDPMRSLYPQRYQDWDIRPNLPELMVEMRQPSWRAGAFAAIKLQSPPEVQNYLDEAYALDPADIRQCYSEWTADVIANFRSAALRWEARKRAEAIERRRSLGIDDEHPTFTR